MMDLQELGRALLERREAMGIPRAEIARRVGVTPTYIWLVEGAKPRKSGEPSRPAEAVLEKWARALGMDSRYTKQLLILGGYPEDASSTSPLFERSASTPLRLYAGPRVTEAGSKETRPEMSPPDEVSSDLGRDEVHRLQVVQDIARFSEAPVEFAQPHALQKQVLLEQLSDVLKAAEAREKGWDESVALLESFLAWLKYRMERPD